MSEGRQILPLHFALHTPNYIIFLQLVGAFGTIENKYVKLRSMNDAGHTGSGSDGQHVTAIVLLIISWLTISPLMFYINRNEKYVNKWVVWVAVIISPFTVNLLVFLIYLLSCFVLGGLVFMHIEDFVNINEYPELTQFSDNIMVVIAEVLALPVYVACVALLLVVVAFTGWSYREASVYVCEYFAPLACAFTALVVAAIIIGKLAGMRKQGRLLSLLPLVAELFMAWQSVQRYLELKAAYSGMSVDAIFNYVVNNLMQMAERSGTNYILANMYVYILPMVTILLFGLMARFVYKRNRIASSGQMRQMTERCDSTDDSLTRD